MVKIRLQKLGKLHQPTFRIVVADPRVKQDGRVKEVLGTYDPRNKDTSKQILLDEERVKHWLDCGAEATETMRSILKQKDLLPERMVGKQGTH